MLSERSHGIFLYQAHANSSNGGNEALFGKRLLARGDLTAGYPCKNDDQKPL